LDDLVHTMSFGFPMGDLIAVSDLAHKIFKSVDQDRDAISELALQVHDLNQVSMGTLALIGEVRMTESQAVRTLDHILHLQGSSSDKSCGQNASKEFPNPRAVDLVSEVDRLKIPLAKVEDTLLNTQDMTNSWEGWKWARNDQLVKSIREASLALESLGMILVDLSGSARDCRNIPQEGPSASFGGEEIANDGGSYARQMLRKAIEQCRARMGESSTFPLCTFGNDHWKRRTTHVWRNHEDQHSYKRPAHNEWRLSGWKWASFAAVAIGQPLVRWTLLQSLQLEPRTLFGERILQNLSFLAEWIGAMSHFPTITMILLFLSVSLTVTTNIILIAQASNKERTSVFISFWTATVFGGLSKKHIGASILEYCMVIMPFLLSLSIGMTLSSYRLWFSIHQQRIKLDLDGRLAWRTEKGQMVQTSMSVTRSLLGKQAENQESLDIETYPINGSN